MRKLAKSVSLAILLLLIPAYALSAVKPLVLTVPTNAFGDPSLLDEPSIALTASGGNGVYSYSVSAGTLPPGLAINTRNVKVEGQYAKEGSYSFTLQVADSAGRSATKTFSVNVYAVPKPKPANIQFTISCPYMPRPVWPSHFTEFFLLNNQKNAIKATGGQRVPLLGQYSGGDPEVLDWQIYWATSVGITNFAFNDWWMEGVDEPLYHTSIDSFLAARYKSNMTFSVQYNGARSATNTWDRKRVLLDHAIPYYVQHYFNQPNYLLIDGLPVIQVLNLGFSFNSIDPFDVAEAMLEGDQVVRRLTNGRFLGAYWICSDIAQPTPGPSDPPIAVDFNTIHYCGFKAVHPYYITSHIWPVYEPSKWNAHYRNYAIEAQGNADWATYPSASAAQSYADSKEKIRLAFEQCRRFGNLTKFIPVVTSDFDSRPIFWGSDHLFYNDLSLPVYESYVKEIVDMARQNLASIPICTNTGKPMFSVGPWNEQGESNTVEPGFGAFTPPGLTEKPDPFALLKMVGRAFDVQPATVAPDPARSFSLPYPTKLDWQFADAQSVQQWQSLADSKLSLGADSSMTVKGFALKVDYGGGQIVDYPVNLLAPASINADAVARVHIILRVDSGFGNVKQLYFGWKGSDYSSTAHVFGSLQEPRRQMFSNIASAPLVNTPGYHDYVLDLGADRDLFRWHGMQRQIVLSFTGETGPFQISVQRILFE